MVDQLKVRPVRSHQEPWGLSCLAIQEAVQVNTSNILLWFVLLCFLLQRFNNLFGMIEHPGPPRERHKVSIWRTRLWSLIQKCGTTDVLLRQGFFGAASSKPTVLAFTGSHPDAHTLKKPKKTKNKNPKGTK